MRTDFAEGERPTAAEAAASFATREMERRAYSDHTRRAYRIAVHEYLDHVVPAASTLAERLDPASVERFAADLEQRGMRATTRHLKMAAVKAFITYLEEQEALLVPFSRDIVIPSVERTRPRTTNLKDVAALVRVAEHTPRDAALITLLLHTGIHLSELISLTLDDLTLPSRERRATSRRTSRGACRCATVRGRGIAAYSGASSSVTLARLRVGDRRNGVREILLDAATVQRLKAYLAVRPRTEQRQLFVTKRGAPLTFAGTSSLVRMYARAAGISGVSARSLRAAYVRNQPQADREAGAIAEG